jgi:hypothetical protein
MHKTTLVINSFVYDEGLRKSFRDSTIFRLEVRPKFCAAVTRDVVRPYVEKQQEKQ